MGRRHLATTVAAVASPRAAAPTRLRIATITETRVKTRTLRTTPREDDVEAPDQDARM
ncbi:hypothetical protein PR003_g15803 [Phytophthora rubi]|uniref:Uncharacterized protein n=1 Tax=Phytophthora rubi TaxID=129364 RepID=A0A6A4EW98_9STRA|nr:hypothetical protein PR003_g15803 [Phytophthora rubi]